MLDIDLEKASDSVWISGFLYKLLNYNIAGRMIRILEAFLRNRQLFIKLGEYKFHSFPVNMGVPQSGVFSPLLFIIFLTEFPINENCFFKFEDNSYILVNGETTDDLTRKLSLSCAGVERWCLTWRMVVNGWKTNITLSNCEASDIEPPMLNGDPCQIKSHTKSLGIVIDNQLTYRQHTEATDEKATRKQNTIFCLCNNKWSLTIPALILLYNTTFLPLLLNASRIWFEEIAAACKEYKINSSERFSRKPIH